MTRESVVIEQANSSLFQYDRWRNTFLQRILWAIAFFGLLLIGANYALLSNIELIGFISIYIGVLIVTFAPLSYPVKAGTLVAAGYFVGVYTLVSFGPWSGASVYFLGAVVFSALLFDERIDLWVFALNTATILVTATLSLTGILELAFEGLPPTGVSDWLSYSVDYLVFSISLLWAINLLKREFRSVVEQFQSALSFLSKDRSELEKRVEERTAGLTKKTDQLRAASFIARQTADIQDLREILDVVVNLVTDQFGFYHTGIFLVNETGEDVVLQAASSEGGKRMIENGHSLKVSTQGIVGFVAGQKRPRIALDVGTDAAHFDNPELPNTHSEVALPMLIRNKVLGVLDIQSDQPNAFTNDDIDVLQTLADQVAVAIENARLLDEAQSALMQIEALTNVRTREAWNQTVSEGNYAYTYTPLGLNAGKTSAATESALQIPISLRGQKIGSISITRKDKTPWTDIEIELISEVANQTGLAVDNVRLVEEATKRARQEQTVGELATRFSQSLDIDNLLQTAARELGRVSDVAEVSVFVGHIPEQTPQKRKSRNTSG